MRHSKISTTMEAYAQAGMDQKRVAQRKAVDLLLGRNPRNASNEGAEMECSHTDPTKVAQFPEMMLPAVFQRRPAGPQWKEFRRATARAIGADAREKWSFFDVLGVGIRRVRGSPLDRFEKAIIIIQKIRCTDVVQTPYSLPLINECAGTGKRRTANTQRRLR